MKLVEARQFASNYLNTLSQKKNELTKILEDKNSQYVNDPNFDKAEITNQIAAIEKEYDRAQDISDRLSEMDYLIESAERTRQQNEQAAKNTKELLKILEVYRRISKGDKVPFKDEKKLMDYSHKLYAAAKNMALLNQNAEGKKRKSLWKKEDEITKKPADPSDIADNTEIINPLAGAPYSSGADKAGKAGGKTSEINKINKISGAGGTGKTIINIKI